MSAECPTCRTRERRRERRREDRDRKPGGERYREFIRSTLNAMERAIGQGQMSDELARTIAEMNRRMPHLVDEAMLAMVANGDSHAVIAGEFGITQQAVSKRLDRIRRERMRPVAQLPAVHTPARKVTTSVVTTTEVVA